MQNAIKSIIDIDKDAENLKRQREEELINKKKDAEENMKFLWKKADKEISEIKQEIIDKNKLREELLVASIADELKEKEEMLMSKYEKIKTYMIKDAVRNIISLTKEE